VFEGRKIAHRRPGAAGRAVPHNEPVSRARRTNLAVVPDLERELDELYGLPLGEFTAARNELAKRLEKAGQKREAESVGGLAKPSISAWAVNQLARREADRVRELSEAGEELVAAQKAALAGKGADRFDEASRRQRDAVRTLLPAAIGILEDAGHRPSDAVKERIASSLRAASVDPDGRRLLAHGRLEEDFESAGLGLLAGIAPAQGKRVATPKRSDEARLRKAREQLEAAREEERRVAEVAAEAEREAEQAAAAADEAAKRARKLAEEAARAREAADEAEQALARLEKG
jgi:hypothetical protein